MFNINMRLYILIFFIKYIYAQTDIELCLIINNIEYKNDLIFINSDKNIILKLYNNLILECNENYKLIKIIDISKYKNIINPNINNKISFYKHNCINEISCLYIYSIKLQRIYLIFINNEILNIKEYSYANKDIMDNCVNNIVINEKSFKCNNYTFEPDLLINYITNYNKYNIIYILIIIITLISLIILFTSIYILKITKLYLINRITFI
ncbi:unknown similar to AMEV160 [Choristoneura rosaceana entomopoxvirus 'L']|uniref:Uncharacterized protein n=1 Tax=Choristoneura rosaceana entomopoxvirus 'L' TaxID=1293539 RepID=A0ABM9QKJ0_9POXV|nr:unknown similar to AMEV160 [Choristoneura rosaceana entomopoxvirus 'L']CCU56072.1 unknown similar to AMEV160 [Choristoneura rosaceana entomopoxvirus 'L']